MLTIPQNEIIKNLLKAITDTSKEHSIDLVRCKECKHYGTMNCAMDTYLFDVTEECFCSYGERKDKR